MIAAGVEMVLKPESDIVFRGHAETEAQLIELAEREAIDVAILDVRVPGGNGIEICRRLCQRFASLRVLMLTSFSDESTVRGAFSAGASGYALKNISFDLLPLAIRQVHRGGIYLPAEIAAAAGLGPQSHLRTNDSVTEREGTIIRLIGEGKTNKEIAQLIGLSPHTVKFHIARLLKRHGFQTRAQLVRLVSE